MRKLIVYLVLVCMICIPAYSFADGIAGIGWAPNAKGKEIEGYQFDDTNYLTFIFGSVDPEPMGIGWYIGGGITPHKVDETGTSYFHYAYYIFNAGLTFTLYKKIYLYGGIGYTYEDGEFKLNGITYTTTEHNNSFNINGGVLIEILGGYGLMAGYDTASSAASIGFFKRF